VIRLANFWIGMWHRYWIIGIAAPNVDAPIMLMGWTAPAPS
jgi:hypothetical protein